MLKTTGSGWEGYLHEQYTTLPETDDRILCTVVTASWDYAGEVADYDAAWEAARDAILRAFGDHYCPSVQFTLYRLGEAVLASGRGDRARALLAAQPPPPAVRPLALRDRERPRDLPRDDRAVRADRGDRRARAGRGRPATQRERRAGRSAGRLVERVLVLVEVVLGDDREAGAHLLGRRLAVERGQRLIDAGSPAGLAGLREPIGSEIGQGYPGDEDQRTANSGEPTTTISQRRVLVEGPAGGRDDPPRSMPTGAGNAFVTAYRARPDAVAAAEHACRIAAASWGCCGAMEAPVSRP